MFRMNTINTRRLGATAIAVLALGGSPINAYAGAINSDGTKTHWDMKQSFLGNHSWYWSMRFEAGKLAVIQAVPDDHADIDIKVYDQDDNLIVEDTSTNDSAVVSFRPTYNSTYKVVVDNRSTDAVEVHIESN